MLVVTNDHNIVLQMFLFVCFLLTPIIIFFIILPGTEERLTGL